MAGNVLRFHNAYRTPARSTAATIRSHSATLDAIGLSWMMWRPAAAARTLRSAARSIFGRDAGHLRSELPDGRRDTAAVGDAETPGHALVAPVLLIEAVVIVSDRDHLEPRVDCQGLRDDRRARSR